jgi:hypothetical protein
MTVVWSSRHADRLQTNDLDPSEEFRKRVEVVCDELAIAEVHCILDGTDDTSVQVFLLEPTLTEMASVLDDFVAELRDFAHEQRLLRRPMGFGRHRGD